MTLQIGHADSVAAGHDVDHEVIVRFDLCTGPSRVEDHDRFTDVPPWSEGSVLGPVLPASRRELLHVGL